MPAPIPEHVEREMARVRVSMALDDFNDLAGFSDLVTLMESEKARIAAGNREHVAGEGWGV